MWELLSAFAGPVLGYITHRYLDDRKWSKARDEAVKILQDSSKTNDPRKAIEAALLQTQTNRLAKEADAAMERMRNLPGWND